MIKLPSGFKNDSWTFEVRGRRRVYSITVAETVKNFIAHPPFTRLPHFDLMLCTWGVGGLSIFNRADVNYFIHVFHARTRNIT